MPTISVFDGIVIQMFRRDHGAPHFHALYAEHEALVELRDCRVIRGSLPERATTLVLDWASDHRGELIENWNLCSELKTPKEIKPLKYNRRYGIRLRDVRVQSALCRIRGSAWLLWTG